MSLFLPAPSGRPGVASSEPLLSVPVSYSITCPAGPASAQGKSSRVSPGSQRDRARVLLPPPHTQLGPPRPPCDPVTPEAPPNLDAAPWLEPRLPPGCTSLPTPVHGASDRRWLPRPQHAGRFVPGSRRGEGRGGVGATAHGRRASTRDPVPTPGVFMVLRAG